MRKYETVGFWFDNVDAFSTIFNDDEITSVFTSWTFNDILDLFLFENEDRLIYKKYDTDSPDDNNTTCIRISSYISLYFKSAKYKYQTLWDSTSFSYDPIHNYDITMNSDETRTPNLTETIDRTLTDEGTDTKKRTGTDNKKRTGTDTLEKTGTDSDSGSSENTGAVTTFDNVSAFNNSDKVTVTGQNTTTHNTTDETTYNSTDSTEYNTTDTNTLNLTHTTDETKKETGSEKYEKNQNFKGNIGNIMTQDMIIKERQISNIEVVRQFVNDVANIICLYVYSC